MVASARTFRSFIVQLFLRWSVRRGVVAITVVSVLLSLALTAILVGLFWGASDVMMGRSLAIAGIVSVTVAPLMSFSVLKLVHELEIARAKVHQASITDSLTGVHNRRFFIESGERMIAEARKGAAPLTMLMFDIDGFKSINDQHGHATGDAVLHHVSDGAQRCLRANDVLARIGGEEFAVLLPGAGQAEGMDVAERVRAAIAATCFVPGDGDALGVTVSIGVAALGTQPTFEALMKAADAALYRAKAAGKNCCVAA
jgi:diguanylate cyclase (GGDEF)-like protein